MSRALSRWCRPIEGSSKMYSTLTNCDPICVANRIRCASPPLKLRALRLTFKYPKPTSSRKAVRALSSFEISEAIVHSFSFK